MNYDLQSINVIAVVGLQVGLSFTICTCLFISQLHVAEAFCCVAQRFLCCDKICRPVCWKQSKLGRIVPGCLRAINWRVITSRLVVESTERNEIT